MNKSIIKSVRYIKGLIFVIKPHILFGWTIKPLLFTVNTLELSKWIAKQDKKEILNDFYTSKRDHSKRYTLYKNIVDKNNLSHEEFNYFEFGVFGGNSFQWWLDNTKNDNSNYYGFDTFEGLPEDWGTYKKGEMSSELPSINDSRAKFVKGLFQDSIPVFLKEHDIDRNKKLIIHFDADLFTSTLFALTSMAPYLKKGDILLFDEFNVPNHEFFAFKMFCESFYIKTKLIGSVNNYYQVAFKIE